MEQFKLKQELFLPHPLCQMVQAIYPLQL